METPGLILFITPPSAFTAYTGTKINAGVQHYPLLSYMYLSSYVKKFGFQTRVLDLGIEKNPWPLLGKVLKKMRPRVVAMTCTTPLFYEVRLIGMIAKAILGDSVTVVQGGIHVSALPEESLTETMCDAVIFDEGEITFKEICSDVPFQNIQGMAYRNDKNRKVSRSDDEIINDIVGGKPLYEIDGIEDDPQGREIRRNLPRPLMTNAELDALPYADLDLYDIYRYKNPKLIARGYPMIQMETSRGCPFHCNFCSADDAYRVFSPARVVEEMKEFKRRGIKEIRIIDDQFATNMKRAKAIFELMLKNNLKIHMNLANGVRADRLSAELLQLGKRAGLYQLGIGFESGDQVALDSMQKGLKDGVSTGFKCMEIIRQTGLETVGFFMFGAAGDTEEAINRTIAYAKALRPDYAKVTISTPFPDTRLYADFKRKGLIKSKRWDLYNIHRAEDVYEHPNGLKPEMLRFYYNLFYSEYYLFNWPYVWRKFLKSVKKGTIFYDLWYGLKTFCPRLIPGDPRSSIHLKPVFLYHGLRRKIFGKTPNGQISSDYVSKDK